MKTFLKILYNPVEAFRDLKNTGKFPFMALILLLVVVIINQILMIPVTTKTTEISFSSMALPLNDDQIETTMNMMYKLRYLQVVAAVFSHLFLLAFYTLIIWLFLKIAKQKLSFQKTFEFIIHCFLVLCLGDLVNTFLLYYQGIENISNMYEIALTGLNLLTSTERVGVTFYTFLATINPFYIWFVILLTIGLKILADIKYAKAFIFSFIFWAILVSITVVPIYFTQTLLHNKGLI